MNGQAVFGRDMLSNLTSLVNWHVVTDRKQSKVDIDHSCKHDRQFRNEYDVIDIVDVDKTGT